MCMFVPVICVCLYLCHVYVCTCVMCMFVPVSCVCLYLCHVYVISIVLPVMKSNI